ncbi:PREDICTED: pentatricopeptide repeat-containing protein At5g50280, chloroplastic-like [Camelina sativa]|uniref:Pentatricopeptide repeat-containing protein At5g50280, chloroplastic-like n=1 Tax=Camelina sativa TaxID=90675 RepID=A0ABM0X8N6_CAMSA|nr:PREDICTED: pentatricopeptide repeat-containing protein At5g50280, chloroplastic-like [Camelina sativa]
MSMAYSSLATQSFYSSIPLSHRVHFPEPYLLLRSSLYRKTLSLSATSPSSSSSSSIFLSCFDEPSPDSVQQPDNSTNIIREDEVDEEEEGDEFTDPILKFFKSRTLTSEPTEDPARESKFSLQKNRRTSWHLASDFADSGTEIESELEESVFAANQQTPGVLLTPFENGIVAGEILELAKNLKENQTLGEMLSGFEKRFSDAECVDALVMLGESGFVKSCLYFYEWMSLQEPSLASPRACSVLFTLLGRQGMADKILLLLSNLPDKDEFRDVRLYNAAISGLSASQRYGDALEVYEAMDKINVYPDNVTCAIMITTMRKAGRSAKEVWEIFEKMSKKGVKWSLDVFGGLVKSFCDEGLKEEALVIQTEMEKKGIRSNTIVYNTLMDAYNKSNHIEEVEGLFAEMKAKGLKPTAATYNILMDAYARRMQPDIVETLLREMEDLGLGPDVKAYTCLISAYGRTKKMSDMAADAFLRMKKVGLRPSSHSYTALIHAYSVSGWHEKAYASFEEMCKEGIKPSVETYTSLLDAFRRSGDTAKLMEIWKLMLREKIKGTRITYNTLLDGFAKQGHYIEARDVVSEFGKMGLQPSVLTYNMLMNAYARGGQDAKLPQLLKEMAALNLKPDSITYSTMIYAFVRVRDFKRAFFYHKMMVKSGQVPDPRSYEKLRAILEDKAKTKNRKDKTAILGIINSKFGRVKARTKGKKDEFWKYKKNRTTSPDPRRS